MNRREPLKGKEKLSEKRKPFIRDVRDRLSDNSVPKSKTLFQSIHLLLTDLEVILLSNIE